MPKYTITLNSDEDMDTLLDALYTAESMYRESALSGTARDAARDYTYADEAKELRVDVLTQAEGQGYE